VPQRRSARSGTAGAVLDTLDKGAKKGKYKPTKTSLGICGKVEATKIRARASGTKSHDLMAQAYGEAFRYLTKNMFPTIFHGSSKSTISHKV
jgi:hypothetical protein